MQDVSMPLNNLGSTADTPDEPSDPILNPLPFIEDSVSISANADPIITFDHVTAVEDDDKPERKKGPTRQETDALLPMIPAGWGTLSSVENESISELLIMLH